MGLDDNLKNLYLQMISNTNIDGETNFQKISNKELTVAPHFVGNLYYESETKLMVIGRAVNGWEEDYDMSSPEACIISMFEQTPIFKGVVDPNGVGPDDHKYYYKKSKFWKFIKCILEEYRESPKDNWYECPEWAEKIVWSNLYKIAPRIGSNPDWKIIKNQMQVYIDIIKREIDITHPKNILFVTDLNYFNHWKRQPQFKDLLSTYDELNEDVIRAKGTYIYDDGSKANVVVCRRPDYSYSVTDDEIIQMAKVVKEALS